MTDDGLGNQLRARTTMLVIFLGAMWLVLGFDCLFRFCAPPHGFGIVPRQSGALAGIMTAPFIHAGPLHLIHNTIPLAVLGAIILINGIAEFLIVVLSSMMVGGFGTWLFGASNTEHIGASGVVFGFFGYLLFRTLFERRISYVLITLIIAAYYGMSMLGSLIPQEHISWTGHAFGLLGGLTAARIRHKRPEAIGLLPTDT
jgi:membrane associated rhomboid family serine protease